MKVVRASSVIEDANKDQTKIQGHCCCRNNLVREQNWEPDATTDRTADSPVWIPHRNHIQEIALAPPLRCLPFHLEQLLQVS